MSILKLKPACKDYLWGGHRLVEEYGIEFTGSVLAEAWVLSCHHDGASIITNGNYQGKTLKEYIDAEGFNVLGTNCQRFREFPILIKFIDAKDDLSIQVHPNSAFALRHEKQYGKSEMWYIIDAEPGAFLYYGFNRKITRAEFAQRIKNNTLIDVLNKVPVKKGDTLFIESGTLHAIGKGILLAEIQQSSNVTYRIYDYDRVGADGKKRDLHIEKALAVTNRTPITRNNESYPHIADCDYFTVDRLHLDGKHTYRAQGIVYDDSFLSILILDGEGMIYNKTEKIAYKKGDSILITAGSGGWQIEGTCDALLTTIREKSDPIRVGVIIGSSEIQIGIVNDKNDLLDVIEYPTNIKRNSQEIIEETAHNVLALLEANKIPLEQCVGVGIGVPGTIDRRNGKVIYSNNISWRDVSLAKELGEVILCPVKIANDADCAALGEAVAGAGKNYNNIVMLTIGNGVGGGIILNGKTFEGGLIGGAEVGHQVVKVNGRKCTCGRKGCLEAYVSIPALFQMTNQLIEGENSLKKIFKLYDEGNAEMIKIIDQYTLMLGQGIINIVNMFRPQLLILGGAMSEYVDRLIEPLKELVQEESFGDSNVLIPKIVKAELGTNAGMIGAANL